MTVSYKLVAVDIDGTLVGDDLLVRPKTIATLQRCAAAGIIVTLATGRMFQSTVPYAEKLGISAPLITYNGALVKDSGTGEIYHHRTVPLHLARKVVHLGKKLGLHLNVYVDDEYYVEEYNDWARRYEEIATVKAHPVGDMSRFLTREPTKLIIYDQPERMDTYIDYLREQLGADLYLTRSRPIFLEVLHPAVSKVEGLQVLGKRFGIDLAEMMAVGDSYNDVEMLRAVGLSVAMGNAPPDVRAAADWVTGSVEEEGLALAVERFVL